MGGGLFFFLKRIENFAVTDNFFLSVITLTINRHLKNLPTNQQKEKRYENRQISSKIFHHRLTFL